jgi:hypothetical protein
MVTGGFTVTESDCSALTVPVLSVTVTENMNGVGIATTGAVPERLAPDNVIHGGRFAAAYVNPGVPPVSDSA